MIQQLDPQTTLQMAAGEVITRPSAVVKEVLENAIDAKSNDITIDIENSGIASITISDNGHGIGKEQLQLALTRHATSKIQNISDLNHIRSMGFRGEALASICAIAKVNKVTRINKRNMHR